MPGGELGVGATRSIHQTVTITPNHARLAADCQTQMSIWTCDSLAYHYTASG